MKLPTTRSTRTHAVSTRGILLASTLFLLSALGLFAQSSATGTITGRVINKGTGEYLRNALVTVAGTDISTLAEDGGAFHLLNVPSGTVKLLVTYTGLDSQELTVTLTAGQTVRQDVSLSSKVYDDVITLGAFEVSTGREGNAKAIMEQHYAVNYKKVIASDAIGNVSEGNVGEFLKLMPGVAMDYVEADTRSMRVRGLNPKYANVTIDGMQIASSGSSNVATGRAFEFEQLSISSIETVELSKTPTPDQPSSVAGSVNLKTKGAFDRKGRRISYSGSLAFNSYYKGFDRSQGWDNSHHAKMLPNASLEYSDVIADGKLGIIAGFTQSSTIAAQKHIWLWQNNYDQDKTNDASELPIINWIWYQDGPKPTERANYNLRLDYRLNDNLSTYARIDLNLYDARFYNRTLSIRPGTYDMSATDKYTQTITAGRISMDTNQFMQKAGQTVALTNVTSYNKGNFSADLALHYSRSNSWYKNRDLGHFSDVSTSLSGISWKMSRPSPGSQDLTFTQTSGPSWSAPTNYAFDNNSIVWHERWSRDQQYTARIDFKNDLSSLKIPQTLKYGLMHNLKVSDFHRYGGMQMAFAGADRAVGTSDDPNPGNYVDDTFSPHWGVGGNMNGFAVISPWKVYNAYKSNPNWFVENNTNNITRRLRDNWNFKETIDSIYFQDIIKLGKLELAPGIRYEKTDSWGKGAKIISDAAATAASGGASVNSGPWLLAKYGGKVTGSNDYSNTLKYLHGNFKMNKDTQLRFSYHDSITRADVANLVAGISNVNDTDRVVTASNPDIKPESAKTINISIEHYFEPVGYFSATIFESTVKDLQYSTRFKLDSTGYEGDTAYANWDLIAVNNASKTIKLRGMELDYQQQLSFLPGYLKGLGVFANYTKLSFDDWAFYLGSPKWTANGGLSFNYGKVGARLNFNYVGKILNNAARTYNPVTNVWTFAAPYSPEFQKTRLACDLNVEFKLNRYVTIFLDGRNITNEPSQYTYRGVQENFIRVLRTGSIWMIGIKGSF